MTSPNRSLSAALRAVVVVTAVAVAFASSTASVTVRPGDTLHEISHRVGISVDSLVRLNGLSDPNLIVAGMVLKTGKPHGPAGHGDRHVVRRGETVAGIAGAHGVSVDTLVRANGIVGGQVFAGVALRLTLPPALFNPQLGGGVHIVTTGDTLAAIAAAHGTTTRQLMRLNDISDPDIIRRGAELRLPGWRCPIDAARFSNDWSVVKPDGRIHAGVDMFAARGSSIVAPVDGEVTQATGKVGGLSFTLVADDGTVYYGAHMESAGPSGRVEAGDVLGTVGTSGNAVGTSPHLHFEVHPDGGEDVNPYPTLLESCG